MQIFMFFWTFIAFLGQACLHLEIHGFQDVAQEEPGADGGGGERQSDGILAEFEDGQRGLDRDGVALHEAGLVEGREVVVQRAGGGQVSLRDGFAERRDGADRTVTFDLGTRHIVHEPILYY